MTATTLTTSQAWIDGKRHLWLLSPLVPVLAVLGLAIFQFTGIAAFAWSGPLLLYVIIPFFDWLIGTDRSNPPESAVEQLENDRYYRFIVYAYIPAQFV